MTKAKYCDECQHFKYEYTDVLPKCAKGHKPRFFQPQGNPMNPRNDWGWKKRCDDFELDDHVKLIETNFTKVG